MKENPKGLYVPLITPMLYGSFDAPAMAKLIASLNSYVDGYVPCLSSGEGAKLSDEQWKEVVAFVRSQTNKPLFPGIKREHIENTLVLEKLACELGCDGITVPVPFKTWSENKAHLDQLLNKTTSDIIIYNTETAFISNLEHLQELGKEERIVAIKDSSMNREFFAELCATRLAGELSMSVLQGMEHQLDVPKGCDGYLVSLLNVEPELVKDMFETQSEEIHREILRKFMYYNLGGDWFITLKSILYQRDIINSSEQVEQAIPLDPKILAELRSEIIKPGETNELKMK